MLKKIILLIGCALVFGCGSSDDKNVGAAATSVAGGAGTSSWGVPNSSTSSWGVPSTGISSWGVPTEGGTAASGGGGGAGTGAGGYSCETVTIGLPKCPTVTVCSNGSSTTFATAVGTYTDQIAALTACQ